MKYPNSIEDYERSIRRDTRVINLLFGALIGLLLGLALWLGYWIWFLFS
jgi:hypothetical protein